MRDVAGGSERAIWDRGTDRAVRLPFGRGRTTPGGTPGRNAHDWPPRHHQDRSPTRVQRPDLMLGAAV